MFRKSLMPLTLTLLSVLISTKVFAQIGYVTRTKDYKIKGETALELALQIAILGSLDPETKIRFASHTEASTKVNGICRKEGSLYVLKNVSATSYTTYLYPKWTPPQNVDPELVKDWNTFLQKVEIHERGHMEIGNLLGKRLYDDFKALKASSCKALKQQSKKLEAEYYQEIKKQFKEYDDRTSHGILEGAKWPLRDDPSPVIRMDLPPAIRRNPPPVIRMEPLK
jgi:predicted secreted Zn-dependent protease